MPILVGVLAVFLKTASNLGGELIRHAAIIAYFALLSQAPQDFGGLIMVLPATLVISMTMLVRVRKE